MTSGCIPGCYVTANIIIQEPLCHGKIPILSATNLILIDCDALVMAMQDITA